MAEDTESRAPRRVTWSAISIKEEYFLECAKYVEVVAMSRMQDRVLCGIEIQSFGVVDFEVPARVTIHC
jgi:hypothetical protein